MLTAHHIGDAAPAAALPDLHLELEIHHRLASIAELRSRAFWGAVAGAAAATTAICALLAHFRKR